MDKLLEGEDISLAILRQQLEEAKVSERKMTGVGFYLTFVVPDNVRRLQGVLNVKFGDVHAEIPGLANGAGFLLYLRNGYLNMLEAYTYDEPWPQEIGKFELSYDQGETRDLEKLLAVFRNSNTRE